MSTSGYKVRFFCCVTSFHEHSFIYWKCALITGEMISSSHCVPTSSPSCCSAVQELMLHFSSTHTICPSDIFSKFPSLFCFAALGWTVGCAAPCCSIWLDKLHHEANYCRLTVLTRSSRHIWSLESSSESDRSPNCFPCASFLSRSFTGHQTKPHLNLLYYWALCSRRCCIKENIIGHIQTWTGNCGAGCLYFLDV